MTTLTEFGGMKLVLFFATIFVTVSAKDLLFQFGQSFSQDKPSDESDSLIRWQRWSKNPGVWCQPVSFGNRNFTYFTRNYSTALLCYGSIVFSEEASLILHKGEECGQTMRYDALFPFHFVSEWGKVKTYYRIETGRVALRGITRLVRSRSDDENFEASWALVVKWKIETWDYVMMQQDLQRGLLVQAALFCDDKHASCYVVYSYGDQTHIRVARGRPNKVGAVGWMRSPERCEETSCDVMISSSLSWETDLWLLGVLGYHHCPFEDECYNDTRYDVCAQVRENMRRKELFYEIPSSRTADIRYLPLQSNIDVPGVFLFSVSAHKLTPDREQEYLMLKMEPKTAYIHSESSYSPQNKNFTISGLDCELDNFGSGNDTSIFEVLFTGEQYSVRMPAFCSTDKSVITGYFPFWSRDEDVSAYLYVNGRRISQAMNITFPKFEQSKSDNSVNIVSRNESNSDSSNVTVSFTWSKDFFEDSQYVIPHILSVEDKLEKTQDPFLVKRFVLHPINNTGVHSLSLSIENFVFIQLTSAADEQTSCVDPEVSKTLFPCADKYRMNQVPLVPATTPSCALWLEEEGQYSVEGGGDWTDGVEKYYGCPRRPKRERGIEVEETDAHFAREEATNGNAWKYDPCCSHVNSKHVDTLKFCTYCECNEGADFCIISRRPVEIRVQRQGKQFIHETTNQCCYNTSGSLIVDLEQGAGSASKEINSPYNVFAHYKTDIAPYLSCCKGRKMDPKECRKFREFRPAVIGQYYVPSYVTMTTVERDPHFRTLDGLRYTFNDLGVYTMLALNTSQFSTGQLELQISTRRKRNGTILSGFAIQDSHSMVEGYLPPGNSSELEINVNGNKFTPHEFLEMRLGEIEIREITSSEFVFTLTNHGLSIRVIVTDSSYLNIATTPPLSMIDDVIGLLGNFDGDPKNDLCARNGTCIPANSTLEEIHEVFGKSWKVQSEYDWLFSQMFALRIENDIQNDMPFEPNYQPIFRSHEEENQAKQVCEDDKSCILDLSLTNDSSFANARKTLKNLTDKLEEACEGFEETKKVLIREVREEKVRKRRGKLTSDGNEGGVFDRNWEWLTLSFSFLMAALLIVQGRNIYRLRKRPHLV